MLEFYTPRRFRKDGEIIGFGLIEIHGQARGFQGRLLESETGRVFFPKNRLERKIMREPVR
jgi:hypothetical protein